MRASRLRLRLRRVSASGVGRACSIDGRWFALRRSAAGEIRRRIFAVDRAARIRPRSWTAPQLCGVDDLLARAAPFAELYGCSRSNGFGDGLYAGESIAARIAARPILPDDARAVGLLQH